MKQQTWNNAMAIAVVLLSIVSLPFFAVAFTDGIGDFDDFAPGDFDDSGIGDFDDFAPGDFDDFLPGDFDDFNPGDIDDSGSNVIDINPASPVTNIGDLLDEFDDDLGPFDNNPGNPPGDDFVPNPDPDNDGCVVDCSPGPTPGPTPIPQPSPSDDDSDRMKIFIHQIFLDDPFAQKAGNVLPLRITFENDGNKDMDNTKVIVVIPDFGARDSVGPIDLDAGKKVTRTLMLELPADVMPGTYPVRLYIHNLQTKRIVHREIEIVDYS